MKFKKYIAATSNVIIYYKNNSRNYIYHAELKKKLRQNIYNLSYVFPNMAIQYILLFTFYCVKPFQKTLNNFMPNNVFYKKHSKNQTNVEGFVALYL